MTTPKTGGSRGRPVGGVMDHPDRYALAMFDAKVAIAKARGKVRGKARGVSERAVLKTLLAFAIGKVVPTPDNLAALSQGLPFRMWTLPLRLPPKELKRDRVEDERYRDALTPYVADLQHQLRNLRTRNDWRGVWHRKMRGVYVLVMLRDGDAAAKIDLARQLAASVGESGFFEKELVPQMTAGIERAHEAQSAP
jgi:hypothetical protein